MEGEIMCHLTPCGNCIIHDGPYNDTNGWGQIDTTSTCRGAVGNTTTATTQSRTLIHCYGCNQIFYPVPREWC